MAPWPRRLTATIAYDLENLLTKSREGQFYCQVCRPIVLIDDRIHFDDFKTEHAAMVGDDFHRQMGFAVGRSPAHGSTDARGVFGVNPVHVERDVVSSGAASGQTEGFFHDGAHA